MAQDLEKLIKDIEREVRYTERYIGKDRLDDRVMQAMKAVPREQFVSDDMQASAFYNGPLPIGHGQTISQPYIVALMSDLVAAKPDQTILEIGTGSGYQTAVLSQLCKKVFTVEVIAELSEQAQKRFNKLGYTNIEARIGNGYQGWPEHAPYDGIIVTAASTHVPQPLIEQLKPGGHLVIPVGMSGFHQELMLIKKDDNGNIDTSTILGVAFVPLVEETSDDEATH